METIARTLGFESPLRREHPVASPLLARTDRRRLRILLVDDNELNQRVGSKILESCGHQIALADDGVQAVEMFEGNSFDLILMDVQMPRMNGFEATAAIREKERSLGLHIPIVAMTARAMKGDREICLEAGMDDYVSKPFRTDELLEVIYRMTSEAEPGESRATEDLWEGSGSALDAAALVENCRGDMETAREIAVMFLDHHQEWMADVRKAVESGNPLAVDEAAHRLKSALGGIRAGAAYRAASHIEMMGKENDLGEAPLALASLETEIERLKQAIDVFVNKSLVSAD